MFKKIISGIMIGLTFMGTVSALAATPKTQTSADVKQTSATTTEKTATRAEPKTKESKPAERQTIGASYNFSYTSLSAKKVTSGSTVTAKAVTFGNTNGVKYKFVVSCNNWESWYVAQKPSTNTSAAITTKKAGTYTVYVDAVLPNGKVITKSNTFMVTRTWSLKEVSAPTRGKAGTPVTIAPQISGKGTGLRYKYVWQKDNWKQWGVIKDFSTAKNVSFTPKEAGTYTIYIDAKDAYGNVVTVTKQITVNKYNVNVSVSSSAPNVGGSVKVSASGAPSGAQYKFVASYDNWKHWHVIQNFSTKSTASFSPKHTGNLQVYVDAKYGDKTTTEVTPKKYISSRPKANWKFNNFALYSNHPDAVKSFYLNTGKFADKNFPHIFHRGAHKLKANVTGNTKGLQYKFVWSKLNWQEWGVIQDFSLSNTAFFTPPLFSVGDYDIYVDVKDSYGNVVTQKGSTYVSNGRFYYVCNNCGFKTNGSSDVMHEHFKKQILSGNMECGSYRTDHIYDRKAGSFGHENFYKCNGCSYKTNIRDGIAPMRKHIKSRTLAGHNECNNYSISAEDVKYSKNIFY